jgi:hypothetical protein
MTKRPASICLEISHCAAGMQNFPEMDLSVEIEDRKTEELRKIQIGKAGLGIRSWRSKEFRIRNSLDRHRGEKSGHFLASSNITCHQGVSVRYFYAVTEWVVHSFRTITRVPYVVFGASPLWRSAE